MIEFKVTFESVEYPEPLHVVMSFPLDFPQLKAGVTNETAAKVLQEMGWKALDNVVLQMTEQEVTKDIKT